MSKIIRLMLAVCLILSFAFTAYAEADTNTTVEVLESDVLVTGTTDRGEGTDVTIMMVRPGKDISSVVKDADADGENLFNNSVACVVQTEVKANKSFEYCLRLDENEKSGIYTLRVKVYGETEVREEKFAFVNEQRKTDAENSVEECTNKTDTDAFLSEYASDLDLDAGAGYSEFSRKEKDYVIGRIIAAKTDKKTAYTDSVAEVNTLHAIKELDREGLKEYVDGGDVLCVDDSLLSSYSSLSKAKKERFAATFYNKLKGLQTPDDVNEAFSDSYEYVNPASGNGGSGSSSWGGSSSSSSGNRSSSVSKTSDSYEVKGTSEDTERPYIIEAPESEGFTDMESVPWAITAVKQLADRGILHGRSKDLFCPHENVTREEFVKMVVAGLSMVGAPDHELKFTDVEKDAWYILYLETGVGCKIINGISETEFGIGKPITRQDMAVILYRAAEYCEISIYEVADKTFTDEESIADYAKDAVKSLANANTVNGMGDGSFMPEKTATRAEAAVMLYNLLYK